MWMGRPQQQPGVPACCYLDHHASVGIVSSTGSKDQTLSSYLPLTGQSRHCLDCRQPKENKAQPTSKTHRTSPSPGYWTRPSPSLSPRRQQPPQNCHSTNTTPRKTSVNPLTPLTPCGESMPHTRRQQPVSRVGSDLPADRPTVRRVLVVVVCVRVSGNKIK